MPGDGFDAEAIRAQNVSEDDRTLDSVAAKCLLLDDALSPADMKRILIETSDPRPEWAGKVVSGGLVNATRAMTVAAMTDLLRSGVGVEEAAQRLHLASPERERIISLSRSLVPRGAPARSYAGRFSLAA